MIEKKLLVDLKNVRKNDFFKSNEKVVDRLRRVLADYKSWVDKVEVFLLTNIQNKSVVNNDELVFKGDGFVVAWGNTYYKGSDEYKLIMNGDF